MSIEQGTCPKCGCTNLEYGCRDDDGDGFGYDVECPECGFRGVECYETIFAGYSDKASGEYLSR